MREAGHRSRLLLPCVVLSVCLSPAAFSGEPLQWSGFALVRGATTAPVPFDADRVSTQAQAGLDWSPSPTLRTHLHLLARSDEGDSQHGRVGTPEAYLELWLRPADDRIRVRAGAFFLPTSRENVDELWENAYA